MFVLMCVCVDVCVRGWFLCSSLFGVLVMNGVLVGVLVMNGVFVGVLVVFVGGLHDTQQLIVLMLNLTSNPQ